NPLHLIMTRISPQAYFPPFGVDYPQISPFNTQLASCFPPAHSEILGPIGVYVEGGWAYPAYLPIANDETTFVLAGRRFRITGFPSPLPVGSTFCSADSVSIGAGIQISPVGAEILGLIHAELNQTYVAALAAGLKAIGLQLTPA